MFFLAEMKESEDFFFFFLSFLVEYSLFFFPPDGLDHPFLHETPRSVLTERFRTPPHSKSLSVSQKGLDVDTKRIRVLYSYPRGV